MTDEAATYVVRIWNAADASHATKHGLRASVRPVGSEDTVLFDRIDALAEYLARPLPVEVLPRTPTPGQLNSGEDDGTP